MCISRADCCPVCVWDSDIVSNKRKGEALVLCSKAVHQQKVPKLLLFPSDETLRFIDSRLNCICCALQTAGKKKVPKTAETCRDVIEGGRFYITRRHTHSTWCIRMKSFTTADNVGLLFSGKIIPSIINCIDSINSSFHQYNMKSFAATTLNKKEFLLHLVFCRLIGNVLQNLQVITVFFIRVGTRLEEEANSWSHLSPRFSPVSVGLDFALRQHQCNTTVACRGPGPGFLYGLKLSLYHCSW